MIGTVLNNRYRLDAELGHGGMGVVYRGHDAVLDRAVAVKVLSATTVGSAGRARLLREARAAARLNHPNIVGIYDAGEAADTTYIVMELLDGQSLEGRRPRDVAEIVDIGRQVCAALDHAHAHGIIHRDLKPENILVTAEGTAKLTDFGLARSIASRITAEGALVGTVFYLSPEQALGRDVDGRTDLYALGVMLYELAAGRLPFAADDALAVISQHLYAPVVPPTTYNPAIPPALEALIIQLMSKEPDDRPRSAAVVRQALDRLAEDATRDTPLPGLLAPVPISPLDQLVRGRLVAREHEFAEARDLWRRAAAGQGNEHVLLIVGSTGVGKTPLVRDLTALAQVSGAGALAAECYAEGGAPYAPIAEIVRDALAVPGLDLAPTVLADLIALAPDLQARYPQAGRNPELDPQADRQRLFESMVALCTALSARRPLLIVVENVHWADGGTLYLLRHVARRSRAAQLRLLIVLSYSEAEQEGACCLNDVLLDLDRERLAARLKLSPFDRDQTARVLATMFQQEMPVDLVDDIYWETEGNLFYIEEVCRALVEQGQVFRQGGRWQRAGREAIQIPPSVRSAVQSRVGRLSAEAQDVLRLAAVVGREFDFQTLQRAGEWSEEQVVDALEQAERGQLVAEVRGHGGETFAFAHGLVRSSLRDSVSSLRRHRMHRRVAEAVEELRPDDYAALAYHHAQAGDEARAIAYYRQAGDRAAAVFSNEDAVRLYSDALALVPADTAERFDLLAARARTYDLIARRPEQRADAEAMLALADRLGDGERRCDALLALADVYLGTEFSRATEPARQAVALAQALGDRVREGHALRRLGWAAWQLRNVAESGRLLSAAVERFRGAGCLAEAATCLHTLSLVQGISGLGDLDAARHTAEEALALSRQIGDRRQEAWCLRRVAITYTSRMEYAQALPYAEQALALHHLLGDREAECHALNGVGLCLAYLRRFDEAERYFRQAIELAEAIQSVLGLQMPLGNLIELHYRRRGEYQAAIRLVDHTLAGELARQDEFAAATMRSWRAICLALLGRFEPALAELHIMLSASERLAGATAQAQTLALMGRIQAEMGDFEQARRSLDRALDLVELRPEALPSDLARVLTDRAMAAWLEGTDDALRSGLADAERAVRLLSGTEWKFVLSDALYAAAQLHLALGDADSAAAEADEAAAARSWYPLPSEHFLLIRSRALRGAGRTVEAGEYLRQARERMLHIAGHIDDEEARRRWLSELPVNRLIAQEWAAHGGG